MGNCLLSAAFLCYSGAFTFEYRSALLQKKWCPDLAARQLPATIPFRPEAAARTSVHAAVLLSLSRGLHKLYMSRWSQELLSSDNRHDYCSSPSLPAITPPFPP